MNKEVLKKNGDELQNFLAFRKHGYVVKSKKGKGSYSRNIWKRGGRDGE